MPFGTPSKTDDGRYFAPYKKEDGTRLMVQLNRTRLMNAFAEPDDLTLEVTNSSPVDAIDQSAVQSAKENRVEWFKKELADKTLETMFINSVKDGIMNVDKVFMNDTLMTKVYDWEKNPVDPDSLQDGTECDVILECAGMWFMRKNYQLAWRVAQIRTRRPPPPPEETYPEEYMFQDAEDDE